MRNHFVTPFWNNLYLSLPASLRDRYVSEMQAAERWELMLDAAVEFASRARTALAKPFQTLRSAPGQT
ncbi:MAG TPA: hypothetical protein VM489_05355 [Burkholderiales bacterium]|nr:hypothetical protein [Burkholderiales bacterium]